VDKKRAGLGQLFFFIENAEFLRERMKHCCYVYVALVTTVCAVANIILE